MQTASSRALPEGRLPAPRLEDVRLEDLKQAGRLLDLHGQAVARGLVTASEHDRLQFLASAAHALSAGKANPAGLFAWLVRNRCRRTITAADEDSARRTLREHLRGDRPEGRERAGGGISPPVPNRPPASRPPASRPGEPSPDAQIVKAVREACIRAGFFRDPWPTFQSRNPQWDRTRWDAALAELGLA